MSRNLFITGTGTDIGKTYVSGLIAKALHEAGLDAAYYKAAMSGNERRPDGTLIPGDALFVKEFAGISQSLESMCPYVYEHAVSPHLASRIEGNPVRMAVVEEKFRQLSQTHDYVVVEGSGGFLGQVDGTEGVGDMVDVLAFLGRCTVEDGAHHIPADGLGVKAVVMPHDDAALSFQ